MPLNRSNLFIYEHRYFHHEKPEHHVANHRLILELPCSCCNAGETGNYPNKKVDNLEKFSNYFRKFEIHGLLFGL